MPSAGRKSSSQSQLFKPQGAAAPAAFLVAHIDGGARGNPGPAGYGVVIKDHESRDVARLSAFLGHRTNNFAEYSALLAALDYSLQNGHTALRVLSDSELLVKQMRGEYKARSAELRPLYERARALAQNLRWFRIEHVRREFNSEADRLANQAMDKRG